MEVIGAAVGDTASQMLRADCVPCASKSAATRYNGGVRPRRRLCTLEALLVQKLIGRAKNDPLAHEKRRRDMFARVKRALFGIGRRVGAFELVADSRWRRARLLILGYHGISQDDEHQWDPELYMPPEQFHSRLLLLRDRGYNVLSLDDALRRLYADDLPPRAVAITFDDGYVDFYRLAYPLLTSLGMPATVYLTTYHCDDNRPAFDVVASYLLWRGRGRNKSIAGSGLLDDGGAIDLRSPLERSRAHAALRASVSRRRLSAVEKDDVARRLAERVDVDYDDLRRRRILHLMTPAEVHSLSSDLVDVQLHTHRHRTPRDRASFHAEITDNLRRIDAITGSAKEHRHFCYPSGDYDSRFLPWLRELRVESASTCEPGLATMQTEPLRLPRMMDTSVQSLLTFEAWTAGMAHWLPRRRQTGVDLGQDTAPALTSLTEGVAPEHL